MKSELGTASRALLDAARAGMTPPAAAIARVRAKVDGAVAAGAAAGSLAGWLVAIAVGGAIAIGGALYVADRGDSVIAISAAQPARRLTAPPIAPPAAIEPPSEIAMPPIVMSREPTAAAKPRPVLARAALGREVALLDDAMAALRRGDSHAALAAVRTHASETAGAGQLAEDAAAIEIEVLCQLADPRAATRLVAFDARWPGSAQRARLTKACPD